MRNDRNGVVKLVPRKVLNRDLPLILGEFFYQLRASLDTAMWKAYTHLGGAKSAPNVNPRLLEFPIFEAGKSQNYKKAAFHGVPLPEKLKLWLEAIQPCNADKRTNGSDEERTSNNLLLINDCARKDRHRQLHVVGTVVSDNTALIKVNAPAAISYVRNISADPFQDQFEIAAFGIEGMTAETEIEVDGNFTIEVAVKEIPDDVGIMVRLYQLKDAVAGAIQRFEDAFR